MIGMWHKAMNRRNDALLSAKSALRAAAAGLDVRVSSSPVEHYLTCRGDYRLGAGPMPILGTILGKGDSPRVKGFVGQQQDKQRIEMRSALQIAEQHEIVSVLQFFTNGRSHVPDNIRRRV